MRVLEKGLEVENTYTKVVIFSNNGAGAMRWENNKIE